MEEDLTAARLSSPNAKTQRPLREDEYFLQKVTKAMKGLRAELWLKKIHYLRSTSDEEESESSGRKAES
jgi:hypothetical protein